jgi:hypothetical protein
MLENCENPTIQSSLNRASKDKFVMVLNLPYVLRNRSSEDPLLDIEYLQINVSGTVVPAISIPAVELRYAGQSTNVSSHSRPNYPPLTVNFVVDNEYKNYYVLWKWLEVLNTPLESLYGGTDLDEMMTAQERVNRGNQFEYQTALSILALNEYNEVVMEFQYKNCFITNLGQISYNYKEGEFIETTAEFQFNQLEIIKPLKKIC